MDIELTTGPLAHAAYKPYIFKFMSKSLRAVSMGIVEVEEGDNPIGLELVDAPRGTAQQAADMRDAALERANDFEAKLTDWTAKAQTAIDAVNQVAAAVGGKTQSSVTDAQDTAAGLATHVEGATTGRITAVVGAAQTAAVDVIMKSELGPVIASTASYLPLLGPAMSFSKAAVRLVRAIRATRAIPFVTARNTGVNVERAKVNARLGVFSSCRMLQMLQRQLEAQILLNIAATDDELEANFALLGLPELLADGLELTHPLLVLAVLGRQPLADQLQVLITGHQLTQCEDDFMKRARHGLLGEKALLVGSRRPMVLLDARLVQRGRAAAHSRVRRGRHTLTQARARLTCLQLDCMQLPGHLLTLHRS